MKRAADDTKDDGGAIHGSPAEILRDETRDRTCKQNADQQAAHHRTDRVTALSRRREFGGERHSLLRDGCDDTERQARGDQHAERGRGRCRDKRNAKCGQLQKDDQAAVEAIAERRQQ